MRFPEAVISLSQFLLNKGVTVAPGGHIGI